MWGQYTYFGRVVDERLEGDIVRCNFKLEISLHTHKKLERVKESTSESTHLRVPSSTRNERLHCRVLVDGVVGCVVGVHEKVRLIEGREGDVDMGGVVANLDLGEWKSDLVWYRLVVRDRTLGGACWDLQPSW